MGVITIYKCDICGKETEASNEVEEVAVAVRNSEVVDIKRFQKVMMCRACKDRLWDLENQMFADIVVKRDCIEELEIRSLEDAECVDENTDDGFEHITSNEKDIRNAIKENEDYGFEDIDINKMNIFED